MSLAPPSVGTTTSGKNIHHNKEQPPVQDDKYVDEQEEQQQPEDESRLTAIREDPSSKDRLDESSRKSNNQADSAGIELAPNGEKDVNVSKALEEEEEEEQHRGPSDDTLPEEESALEAAKPSEDTPHDIYNNTTTSTPHLQMTASNDTAQENQIDEDDDPENPDLEDWDMGKLHLINVICCDLNCGPAGRRKPFAKRAMNCCRWTGWFLLLGASMFFVVLLIGAQHQEEQVRSLLPYVDSILYDNQNQGEVCAFDAEYGGNSTTLRTKVEETQKSFANKEEAHLAGYSVLHCGACAACSNYNDLRQQYTTREVLGQVALKCAKKVLFGGGFEKLKQCTMEETLFLDACASCWTQDYICVKQNCIFISIRAFMINTVTNLQVGANDITPSACEEAMCEATEITGYVGFVPCSGASRRRMNITSTIARPGTQQCGIVDVPSWERFFGPSTGHNDFIEDWNATTMY